LGLWGKRGKDFGNGGGRIRGTRRRWGENRDCLLYLEVCAGVFINTGDSGQSFLVLETCISKASFPGEESNELLISALFHFSLLVPQFNMTEVKKMKVSKHFLRPTYTHTNVYVYHPSTNQNYIPSTSRHLTIQSSSLSPPSLPPSSPRLPPP
jgi:hypothetical protein